MNPEQPTNHEVSPTERERQLEAEIAALRIEVARLKELATKDALTGIYNRQGFTEEFNRLNKLEQRSKELVHFAVAICDIDNFKYINDTYGHPVGDEALKHVAEVLARNLRESDVIGRWGGEEFAIAFPDTDEEASAVAADHIRSALEKEKLLLDHEGKQIELDITVSIGLHATQAQETLAELINRADEALYAAKKGGKNQVKRASELK